jgi:homoserine dehydrogenase
VRTVRVALLGFGNVGRALHALLARRRDELAREHAVGCLVTGVASRRLGWIANADGVDPAAPAGTTCGGIAEWLTASRADVVFEAIALDAATGQPALDWLRATLEHGAHAISANKGPVVYGHRALAALAATKGLHYRFEAAVMDGAPVFSLVRECLPLAGLRAIRGVFTSTATVVLEAIEGGGTLADGVAHAQRLGIAEEDPSWDVDGWDSAVKLCALANVVMGGDLRPGDVAREGIRDLAADDVRSAAAAGRPFRLLGAVTRGPAGDVHARVAPVRCDPAGPLGVARGATLVVHWEAEVFPGGLTVTSRDPDPTTTAYGMLADFVQVIRSRD